MPNSPGVLDRLVGLHPRAIDLSLGRIQRLLERLGRPQDRLPPVLHVAGTNGKGSVLAFLRAILEAAGHSVHVYTSPHLVRLTERIVVSGREIEDVALSDILEECEAVNADAPITLFEITTAAAFLAFARAPADVTLLETGLGGRLDATNVVQAPALTAITPVSLDHQSYLGDTLGAIAFEKAGILKRDVVCVCAAQRAEVAAVIGSRASAMGAPLIREGQDWLVERSPDGGLTFQSDEDTLRLPPPALAGAHQYNNAGLAVACIRRLKHRLTVDADSIGHGLRTVSWPARLQRLRDGRLSASLPQGWELWLDGGHNPSAAAALAKHLAEWRDKPTRLLFGMLKTKDAPAFLAALAPVVDRAATVPIPGESGSLTAEEAAMIAEQQGIRSIAARDVSEALRSLTIASRPAARILICGSLYLAGAVLAQNEL